jgi:endonuclease YncB( thermonuclease family)
MKSKSLKSKWVFYVVFLLGVALLVFIFSILQKGLRVKEVIDGDTIILSNGVTVRYIGIDAPEMFQPFFQEAKDTNEAMVDRKIIRLELEYEKGDTRNYTDGRLLAYVYVGDLFVNAELIKKGLARLYPFRSHPTYIDSFCFLQKQAREAKVGIWSLPVPEKEEHYLGNKRTFKFHRPSCKYALQMAERNKIVFKTREEALDSCYSPCRFCQP